MRTVRRNKRSMKYALYLGRLPIYQEDEDGDIQYYEDEEGNRYPMDTGEYEDVYGSIGDMLGNISMSGGEAEAVEYGLSIADYSAVLVTSLNSYPLAEGAYIWVGSPIEYLYNGEEKEVVLKDGKTVKTKVAKVESADYIIVKKSDSLNYTKWILKAVNK